MSAPSLIESIVHLMSEREQARHAKAAHRLYIGVDPDLVIQNADYYIKSNLMILQAPDSISLNNTQIS